MGYQGVIKKLIVFGLLIFINSNLIASAHEDDVQVNPLLTKEQQNAVRREQQSDKLYLLFTKVIGTQDPEDQYRLGKMFQFGDGVEKDDIQAYVWTALSLTNGYPGATKTLRDLERDMSTYEVDYAIELLRKIRELR
jgi:TPR repeat protein